MNLTAITDPEEAVIKHFVDSLTLLKALEIKKNAKVIDVGTRCGLSRHSAQDHAPGH